MQCIKIYIQNAVLYDNVYSKCNNFLHRMAPRTDHSNDEETTRRNHNRGTVIRPRGSQVTAVDHVPDDGSEQAVGFRAAVLVDHVDALVVSARGQLLHVRRLGVHHGGQEKRTVRVTVKHVFAHLAVHVRGRRQRRAPVDRDVRNAVQIGGHVVVPVRPPVGVRRVHVQKERQVDGGRRVPRLRRVDHDHVHRTSGFRVVPEHHVVPAIVAVAQHGHRLDRPQQSRHRFAVAVQQGPRPVQAIRVLAAHFRVAKRVQAPVTSTCVHQVV